MRGMIVAALACATFAGVGCTGSAKYVQQTPNGGVIELKAGGDPQEVAKLIEQHIGKDYTHEVMQTPQGAVAGTGGAFNPNAPMQPGQAPAANDAPTYYTYSKKTPTGTTPAGMTPKGLPPVAMDGGIVQTGYPQQHQAPIQPMGGVGNGAPQKPAMPFGQQ